MQSPLADVKLRLVESIEDLNDLKRWAGERRETPLGVDTETGGLDIGRHRVRLVQVGDLRTGWAIPFDLWGGGALEILKKYSGEFVGHNIPFDQRFIKKSSDGFELPWHRVHDTLILAALDENVRIRALKPLADQIVDPLSSAGQQSLDDGMRENGWTWETVPVSFTPYWVYGALDAVLTCHIWEKLHPRVAGSCPEAYDLEMGTARVVSKMMWEGLLTDAPYIRSKIEELNRYSEKVRHWLSAVHGISTPNSGGQIARAMGTLGYEIDAVTATGQPRVDKEVLEYIMKTTSGEVLQLAKAVYNVRHAERMVSNYLSNFLGMAGNDGVIRAQIWQLGAAKTHRMSVTDPALQTLHRDDRIVRGSFIPRPGNVFITADFGQIEMRLAAAFSGDEGLIKAFAEADNGGRDFYSGIASELFGEEVSKEDKRRQAVKTMSYAKLYGSGIATMTRSIGLPQSQVRPIYDAFNSRYPGLNRLSREIADGAMKARVGDGRPAVILSSGRRLPIDEDRLYAGINYRIQGTAAEVMKRAGLNLEAAGLGPGLRLFIHDEVLLEAPADQAEEVKRTVEEIMTDDSYAVTIPAEAKILPERWCK